MHLISYSIHKMKYKQDLKYKGVCIGFLEDAGWKKSYKAMHDGITLWSELIFHPIT